MRLTAKEKKTRMKRELIGIYVSPHPFAICVTIHFDENIVFKFTLNESLGEVTNTRRDMALDSEIEPIVY